MGLYIVLNVGCHFIVEWNQFCKKADQFWLLNLIILTFYSYTLIT